VHCSAVLIGKVRIGDRNLIGPNAVIRADEPGQDGHVAPITVGDQRNVQDQVVLHAVGGTRVDVAHGTSVAHGAVVHGPCKIGEGCFIGFNSVVFGATLGAGVVVCHQALVEGVTVPAGLCVPSMQAVCCQDDVPGLEPAGPDMSAFAEKVRQANLLLVDAWSRR
jgi:carbonic anhydrase/acetyltransferase-like protein (isoleucine patch superfamily)